MGNKETLKEEAFLGSTGEGADFVQAMCPMMETFEINGKVQLSGNAIAQNLNLWWWEARRDPTARAAGL